MTAGAVDMNSTSGSIVGSLVVIRAATTRAPHRRRRPARSRARAHARTQGRPRPLRHDARPRRSPELSVASSCFEAGAGDVGGRLRDNLWRDIRPSDRRPTRTPSPHVTELVDTCVGGVTVFGGPMTSANAMPATHAASDAVAYGKACRANARGLQRLSLRQTMAAVPTPRAHARRSCRTARRRT